MKPLELAINNVYFLVSFHDEDLLIPKIETYIYLGKDLLENDNSFYFQSAETYFECGKWQPGLDTYSHEIICMQGDFLEDVFDYSGLQHQLELIKKGGAQYYE